MNTPSRSIFQILNKMSKRFKLKKKIQIINKKTYARALSFDQRIIYEIFNHKKKLIFFSICGALGYYYGYLQRTVRWIRNIEPIANKIDRWVLGKKNKPPPTVVEQNLEEIKLSEVNQERLLRLYLELDKQLPLGVGRGTLYQVFESYGLMETEKRKEDYWKETGYYRERNQKVAGTTAKMFLQLVDFSIGRLKQFNPDLSENDLVTDFLYKLQAQLTNVKNEQKDLLEKRQGQYMKIVKQDQFKQQYVNDIIAGNPTIKVEQVDKILSENGLNGLSVKDHYQIVHNQIVQMTLLKYYLQKKMNSIYKQHKHAKYKRELDQLNKQLTTLKYRQTRLQQEYKKFYGSDIY